MKTIPAEERVPNGAREGPGPNLKKSLTRSLRELTREIMLPLRGERGWAYGAYAELTRAYASPLKPTNSKKPIPMGLEGAGLPSISTMSHPTDLHNVLGYPFRHL